MLFQSLVLLAAGLQYANAATCSSENAGSTTSAVTNIYQTNGLCQQSCSGYTYAITQYQSCWCSNSAPSTSSEESKCDEGCPGYPNENCGSKTNKAYSYTEVGSESTYGAGSNGTVTSTESATSQGSSSATWVVSKASQTSGTSQSAGSRNSTTSANGTSTTGSTSGSTSGNSTVSSSGTPMSNSSDTGAASAGASLSMAATGLVLVLMVALTL